MTRTITKSIPVFGTSTGQFRQKIPTQVLAALPEGVSSADVYGWVYDIQITIFFISCRGSIPRR